MIIIDDKQTDGKNNNDSLLCIGSVCDRKVAIGSCGHRVKHPPYSSEL